MSQHNNKANQSALEGHVKIKAGYSDPAYIFVPNITFCTQNHIFIETSLLQDVGFPTNCVDMGGNPIFSNHVLLLNKSTVAYVDIRIIDNMPVFIYVDKDGAYLTDFTYPDCSIMGIKIPGDDGWYAFDKNYKKEE